MRWRRHEIRDPVHGLIEFDDLEKMLIDSVPFQRLRDVHQLAMCYQVYPGTTHKRFEHCIGVMHLAGRIFDNVFDRDRMESSIRERLDDRLDENAKPYWRRVVRAGALLHDVGHLPFSHAAEKELLPPGWNHERITADMIRESEIAEVLKSESPKIDLEDLISVAWDARKRLKTDPGIVLSPWQTLLNDIVTGDTFGADRMDYLLRDSLHAGVVYGRFDPAHLINALRVVIDETDEIRLGLEIGGIHSAEALLLARYFMYSQVYYHDVRRAYDLHLRDFLKSWRDDGFLPASWRELLNISDSDILIALRAAAADGGDRLHELAIRISRREHFRTIYSMQSTDKADRPMILEEVRAYLAGEFGEDNILMDSSPPSTEPNSFPVLTDRQRVENSLQISSVIGKIPQAEFGLIFAAPSIKDKAVDAANKKIESLLREKSGGI